VGRCRAGDLVVKISLDALSWVMLGVVLGLLFGLIALMVTLTLFGRGVLI